MAPLSNAHLVQRSFANTNNILSNVMALVEHATVVMDLLVLLRTYIVWSRLILDVLSNHSSVSSMLLPLP